MRALLRRKLADLKLRIPRRNGIHTESKVFLIKDNPFNKIPLKKRDRIIDNEMHIDPIDKMNTIENMTFRKMIIIKEIINERVINDRVLKERINKTIGKEIMSKLIDKEITNKVMLLTSIKEINKVTIETIQIKTREKVIINMIIDPLTRMSSNRIHIEIISVEDLTDQIAIKIGIKGTLIMKKTSDKNHIKLVAIKKRIKTTEIIDNLTSY